MKKKRSAKYQPAFCEKLIAHMTKGADLRSFGAIARVSEQTLHSWKKQHPEFLEAYELGIVLSYGWWEEKSRQLGMGKINTGLFIINMRNRFRWLGKDKPDETASSSNDDEIYMTWEKNNSDR